MPRLEDHPVVIARLYVGMSRSRLAEEIGVTRSTIAAIEEGRTMNPTDTVLLNIDRALHLRPGTLTLRMSEWKAAHPITPLLSLQARAILSQKASDVVRFGSFEGWMLKIAPTATAFASLTGCNHTTINRYVNGIRVKFPDTIATALMTKLNLSPEYLRALAALPPSIN